MTTKVRNLLIAFTVISIVGISFIAFRYVGAGALIGLGPDTVTIQMREDGGIFPRAAVSYRGVEVGRVSDMRVTPGGLETDIEIDRSAPDVPASAIAVVANRSAVGEQYIDLQPPRDGGPFLEDGSVIPAERVRTPVPVDSLLANVDALATSVPIPELQATVDELFLAFDRAGPSLQRLLDSSNLLVNDAIANLPQTQALLRDGRIALTTQAQLGPQILSFSRDLNLFTAQLRADDPNLRRLVNSAPPAAEQLEGLIRETGPDLGRTLDNLLTTVRIAEPRRAGLEQFLVTYAGLAAVAPAVVPGDGRVRFGLVLNLADPPYCRNGYLQPDDGWRPATDQTFIPIDDSVFCNEATPVNPRGAQNAPNPDGSERTGGLLDPNSAYPGPGLGAAGSRGYDEFLAGGPAGNGPDTSSQNGQVTAFDTPTAPQDVLRDSVNGAPPVVIPGLGD